MAEPAKPAFDAAAFLASAGLGRRIVLLKPKTQVFSQGDPADSVFYLQEGRAIVTVLSKSGKEATVALLSAGDFVGEESLSRHRAAHGHGYRHHILLRAQDRARQDDPRDA